MGRGSQLQATPGDKEAVVAKYKKYCFQRAEGLLGNNENFQQVILRRPKAFPRGCICEKPVDHWSVLLIFPLFLSPHFASPDLCSPFDLPSPLCKDSLSLTMPFSVRSAKGDRLPWKSGQTCKSTVRKPTG